MQITNFGFSYSFVNLSGSGSPLKAIKPIENFLLFLPVDQFIYLVILIEQRLCMGNEFFMNLLPVPILYPGS